MIQISELQGKLKIVSDFNTITLYDKTNLESSVTDGNLVITDAGTIILDADYASVSLPTSTDIEDLHTQVVNIIESTTGIIIAGSVVALTDAATIALDASQGSLFTVTLEGSRTIGNPTNGTDGQKIIVRFTQDGVGTRLLTLDTDWRLGTDISAVTLSTGAGDIDYMEAVYHGDDAKWDIILLSRGY